MNAKRQPVKHVQLALPVDVWSKYKEAADGNGMASVSTFVRFSALEEWHRYKAREAQRKAEKVAAVAV